MGECIAAYSYIAYSHLLFKRIHRYSAHGVNLIYLVRAQALSIPYKYDTTRGEKRGAFGSGSFPVKETDDPFFSIYNHPFLYLLFILWLILLAILTEEARL